MTDRVNPVPEGFHTVTPYLICEDAAGAVDFYKNLFGATELMRLVHSDGKIQHAEIKIGDSPVMIADEPPGFPQMRGPLTLGGSPVLMFLYVEDVDTTMDRVILHRRQGVGAGGGSPVRRRPAGRVRGSVRVLLGGRDAHRGRVARGDTEAPGRCQGVLRPLLCNCSDQETGKMT